MTSWVRLWADMPTDPKWRTIARKSGQRIGDVIAVFTFLMCNAGCNALKRGEVGGLSIEDLATALDMDEEAVQAIWDAMQDRVLDGPRLMGWEKRQPKREDNSTARVQAHREAAKMKRTVTHCNAPDADTDTDTELEKEKAEKEKDDPKPPAVEQAAASLPVLTVDAEPVPKPRSPELPEKVPIPKDWGPSAEDLSFVQMNAFPSWSEEKTRKIVDEFRDHYRSRGHISADWSAEWRRWVRRQPRFDSHNPEPSPSGFSDPILRAIEAQMGT